MRISIPSVALPTTLMQFLPVTILLSLALCTGCYRMPEEGEVSTVPNTNNPTITRQPRTGMPGIEC